MTANRWLNRTYKVIAILLVSVAVLISAMRLLLPYASHYRVDFQNYINSNYNVEIDVGTLAMDWRKSGPYLVAKHVDIVDTDALKVSVASIQVHVDFWQSVQQRKLITSDISLSGAYIYVDRSQLSTSKQQSNESLFDSLSDLILAQISQFELADSHITLKDEHQEKKFALTYLNWLNKDERHQASGKLIVEGLASDELNILADFNGSHYKSLSGQIFVAARNFNIAPWVDQKLVVEHENTSSDINFDTWLTVANGQLEQLQVEIEDSHVRWFVDNEEQALSLFGGSILAKKNGLDTYVQSTPLNFVINNSIFEPIALHGNVQDLDNLALYLSALDIAGIAKVIPLFVDSEDNFAFVEQLAPTGLVKDLYLRIQNGQPQLSAKVEQLSVNFSQGVPGVNHVSADIMLKGEQAHALVNIKDSAFDFDKHFQQPIPFDSLSLEANVDWQSSDLNISVPNLALSSAAAEISAELGLSIGSDSSPHLALHAQIHRANAEQANLFYPHLLMGQDLVDYLNSAIITGDVSQGQVLFNGQLTDFPFNNNEGIFVVDAELANAKFSFDSEWPAITNFSANLNFTNNSMLITARDGALSGLDVTGVNAEIAELTGEQLLLVNAEFNQAATANVTTLMQASPLRDSVGETLTQLQVSGDVSGNFQLSLPLADVDNTVASGHIFLANNNLALQVPEMDFSHVSGELKFVNDHITTKNVTLNWRGMPLGIEVNAQDEENHFQTDIKLTADWLPEQWKKELPDILADYGQGNLQWQGNLVLNMPHSGGFSYQAQLSSELLNTKLDLPAPYGKTANEKVAVNAQVQGQTDSSTINVKAGEQLSFYGLLDHQKIQFSRAHLVLGNEQMLLPTDGFHITTSLQSADILAWDKLITDILTSLPDSSADSGEVAILEKPERIRGTVQQAELFGYQFHDLSFNLLDQENWWLLQLNAKEARGQVKFYPDMINQGIDIDADFITLPELESEEGEGTKDKEQEISVAQSQETIRLFKQMPPMTVNCDQCKVGLLDLGKVQFDVKREQEDVLALRHFIAERDKSKLSLTGSWQLDKDNNSSTYVVGKLSINDIEREVENFGYASVMKDSGAESSFTFNWSGGPHHFDVDKLNGDVKLEFDDGYLADVSDKGARIFSILSLQSLVRKLTFDFRDIFSDGMFYSSIKGDAHIKDGILYTDNTRMKGAAGDLSIKGNTELAAGKLDYRMSYKPNLTSSLPVLAWISTLNPAVFLAGVALDEVFTSKVVSEFNFELTGNVSEPNLKEVNRKSRDVSVGRSTPPQFVDANTKKEDSKQETPPPTNKGY